MNLHARKYSQAAVGDLVYGLTVVFMLIALLAAILLARAGWQHVQMNEKSGGNAMTTNAAQAE